jgi:hypothetical protein
VTGFIVSSCSSGRVFFGENSAPPTEREEVTVFQRAFRKLGRRRMLIAALK